MTPNRNDLRIVRECAQAATTAAQAAHAARMARLKASGAHAQALSLRVQAREAYRLAGQLTHDGAGLAAAPHREEGKHLRAQARALMAG